MQKLGFRSATIEDCKLIPHRYVSAQEGREIMFSNTEYYDNMTQKKIDYRIKMLINILTICIFLA